MREGTISSSKRSAVLLSLILILVLNSCRLYRLQRNLDEGDAEFLSQVRYIISKEEKIVYLEMPRSERENFKKKFWKKRDTDPDTEMNEFKEQYFERIEEANRRYTAGMPGWLADRGRILILLGPPIHKSHYTMGDAGNVLARPTEIWHYPNFLVIFIDYRGTGDYEFYFFSLGHQAEVNEALLEAKKITTKEEKAIFEYSIKLQKKDNQNFITLEIEKRNLWMKEEEKGMITTLEVELKMFDLSGKKLWNHKKDYPITVSEKELDQRPLGYKTIEIEIDLPPGTYTLLSKIKNLTDNEQRSKSKIIKLE